MADEEYNPFFDESADDRDENRDRLDTNPFNDDEIEDEYHEEIEIEQQPISPGKPIIEVEESEHKNGIPTYTSLEEEHHQQITTIMRSVSMEDIDHETVMSPSSDQDLFVKVDSPEKHTEGYVSYCVTTQVTRSEFEESEYKVRRRYNDFLWLRKRLEDNNPTHIIPPIPEKNTFSKHITDKFDPDYLKIRQKALDKFMRRLVDHPVLSFNENLKTFLTAKAWEMTTARKKQPGAASQMGGSMRNTAAQMMMKNRDSEFDDMLKYNIQFQGKMKTFANLTDKIANDRFYLLEDFQEYVSAFRLWANSESKLTDPLTAVAKSLDMNIENLKNILRIHEVRICEPIREYVIYCDSVKLALKRRDQFQIEHELSTEELSRRKAEKEEIETTGQAKTLSTLFGKDPEKVKEERLTKLNQQIRELLTESEVLSDKREKADHDLKADMDRWQLNKKKDLKALFLEMADRHIKFYETNITAWQSSLEVINKPRAMHSPTME